MSYLNWLTEIIENDTSKYGLNSGGNMAMRSAGLVIEGEVEISATGTVNLNVFQFTGSIIILSQLAIITEITTLNNLTNMYADVYDGTTATPVTKTSDADLSGAPVGTLFTKDKASSEAYTVLLADQARFSEPDDKIGKPFKINAKNGATNYLRFNFQTTDNPVNFKMWIRFEYLPINGATLQIAA